MTDARAGGLAAAPPSSRVSRRGGARKALGRRSRPVSALPLERLGIMLLLLALMWLRAIIPNGYMVDPAAARAGHYALMPCPATGWRWPVDAPQPGAAGGEKGHHGRHGSHADHGGGEPHLQSRDGKGADIEHISVDCPTGIMLSQAVAPALWWPPVLALVPAMVRPLPRQLPARIAYGPVCGPPVGSQAPPLLS